MATKMICRSCNTIYYTAASDFMNPVCPACSGKLKPHKDEPKIVGYIMIRLEGDQENQVLLLEKLKDGWKLYGSPVGGLGYSFWQPIIKEE